MQKLKDLFNQYTGQISVNCVLLKGAGSNRSYYRLTDTSGHSMIGVIGTSVEENHAFCYLSRHFYSRQLPVPMVYAESSDGICYLQEDLGDISLFDSLHAGRVSGGNYSEEEEELLSRAIALLPSFQIKGGEGIDYSHCYPQPAMDTTNVMFDLNYFKYCFLKATCLDFHELHLEDDFKALASDIVSIPDTAFMYRDFQARNVMIDVSGNPRYIDFQGGRRGPIQYDVASFLWQASAMYDDELKERLLNVYLRHLQVVYPVDENVFRQRLRLCVLFRLIQVLGAYGFRGYFERKKHFIDSIPPAIKSLRQVLEREGCPYPYLRDVLERLVSMPQWNPRPPLVKGPLVVRVFSFSYRNGIPEDESGNGGGYVFDCRSSHNPGRYEPYKKLTGLDEPVIRFLEEDGEILAFLQPVYQLADTHVRRYIERGFTDLMFSFGCTGGQHRSVYCAQQLAQHLHETFGIEVRLCHREQGKQQRWEATR